MSQPPKPNEQRDERATQPVDERTQRDGRICIACHNRSQSCPECSGRADREAE